MNKKQQERLKEIQEKYLPAKFLEENSVVDTVGTQLKYWGHNYDNELHLNGLIEFHMRNIETSEVFTVCVFGGANYRRKEVGIVLVTRLSENYLQSWSDHGSLSVDDYANLSEVEKLMSEEIREYIVKHDDGCLFEEAYDIAEELKELGGDWIIYDGINKKKSNITKEDIQELERTLKKMKDAIGETDVF